MRLYKSKKTVVELSASGIMAHCEKTYKAVTVVDVDSGAAVSVGGIVSYLFGSLPCRIKVKG